MKLLKNITLNLILGLNVFILFFLLAEGRIVIPPALQVLGRMHPLLLHFPIVLLFLALVFEVFNGYLNEDSTPSAVKDPGSSKTSPAGRNAVTLLLYGGALSAALDRKSTRLNSSH